MDNLRPPPDGDVSRGKTFIVIVAILAFFSTTTTGLRLWARTTKRQLGWDDLAITLAWVLLLVQVGINVLEYRAGLGRHTYYLGLSQTAEVLKWIYITEILLFFVICFTKISICLFILRIKDTGWLKWCLYALIFGLIATTVACEIILFAQCRPLYAYWDLADRTAGTCWNPVVYNDAILVQVAFSIFSDLVCSLLPIVVLWNIQIPTRLKAAVCGLMTLGLLATACAAVRMSLASQNDSSDLTWSLTIVSDWGTLEENFAIIGANLALSRHIYFFFRNGRVFSSRKPTYEQQLQHSHRRRFARRMQGHRSISLSSRSQDGSMPSEPPKILKTTHLHVSHESRDVVSDGRAGFPFEHDPHIVEDLV